MEEEMSSSKTSAGNEAGPEEITGPGMQDQNSKETGFWEEFFSKCVVMCVAEYLFTILQGQRVLKLLLCGCWR